MHLITNSRLTKFQRCARAHHYRYELGAAPLTDAPALVFGTAIHAALEAYWRAWQSTGFGATESALAALMAQPLDEFTAAKALVMVSAYCAKYQRLAARSEVLAVEREFACDLIDPDTGVTSTRWQLAGKVDAIVKLPDGRVAIVEHKSSARDASAGSDYRARLTLDAQVGIYFEGAAAMGYAPDLCLYDVLVKPSMEPYRATPTESRKYTKAGALYANQRDRDETVEEFTERLCKAMEQEPDRYLIQAELVRSEDERADCLRDVCAVVRAIELARMTGYAPRSAQSCFAHGRCEYLDACHAPSIIDDPHRYRRLPIHQELSEVTQQNPQEHAA